MTTNTIHTTASHPNIRRLIASIPQGMAGGPAVDTILTRAGMALLGRIKKAFVTKARGGTDEAGERWAPLSPKTIAYGRRGGRTKTEKKRDTMPSQALTKKQATRWWDLYRQGLAVYKGNKAAAAKRAWFILKGEGARTLFDKYGKRRVEILRDIGLLLNSLSPGSGSAEQVFRIERGAVTIGTNRKWAAAHHNGVPGRLPQRRLWPPVEKWPNSWWKDITDQVKQGIIDAVIQKLKGSMT